MPTVNTVRMTAKQYLMLGEDPPGVRLEMVDGQIAVSPGTRPSHSFVDVYLTSPISRYRSEKSGSRPPGNDFISATIREP
jgi:hypothetical protein